MKFQAIYCLCLLILSASFGICSGTIINFKKPEWRTEFTEVSIEIDPGVGRLRGSARLTIFNTNSNKGDISLILNRELNILLVKYENGQVLSFERDSSSLIIHSPETRFKKDTFNLYVEYEGSFTERVPELNFLEAWIGPEISYALYSSRWYPVVNGTDYRSKGKITIHVPIDWNVTCSGKLSEEKLLENHKVFVFEINSPVKYSFAAAPFRFLRNKIDGLEMGVYLLNGDLNKAKFYLENSFEIVGFLKEYYGVFPYEGCSLVEIPQDLLGNAGGGSYEGLTFYIPGLFPDKVFYSPSFGHEIGHIWWGNYIRSQEGPIISEGLAQMSMGLYLEHVFGEKIFRILLKNGALELQLWQTARLYFQFISPADPGKQLLPGILHGDDMKLGINLPDKRQSLHTLANSKGFFTYFMLRDLVGSEAFREGLRSAMTSFAWSSDLTLNDLRYKFERASGKNLRWFFDQWFFRKGAPEFSLSYDIKNRKQNYQVTGVINQVREVYRVNAEIVFVNGSKHETRNVEISGMKTPFSFVLPFRPDTVLFDPDYKILRWTEEFKN
jgi:aminopeptidase N